MNVFRVSAAGIAAAISLSGCSIPGAIRDQAQVDPIVAWRDPGMSAFDRSPTAAYPVCSTAEWIIRATNGSSCGATSRYSGANVLPPLGSDSVYTRQVRNATQAELMTFSDLECSYHQSGIYSNQSSINFLTGFTSLIAGAASVVSDRGMGASGRGARNLAALGAVSSGSRGLVNSEVYFSYIGPAVVSEIELVRREARKKLLAKQHCSTEDYPPARAVNDALAYHESCSFVVGLSSLLAKAGKSTVNPDLSAEVNRRGMDRRITDFEALIAGKKAELAAVPADDANADKRTALQTQVLRLESELSAWRDIRTFAAPADPPPLVPKRSNTAQQVVDAEAKVQRLVVELAALGAADPARAAKQIEVTKGKADLATAVANRIRAEALPALIKGQYEALLALNERVANANAAFAKASKLLADAKSTHDEAKRLLSIAETDGIQVALRTQMFVEAKAALDLAENYEVDTKAKLQAAVSDQGRGETALLALQNEAKTLGELPSTLDVPGDICRS